MLLGRCSRFCRIPREMRSCFCCLLSNTRDSRHVSASFSWFLAANYRVFVCTCTTTCKLMQSSFIGFEMACLPWSSLWTSWYRVVSWFPVRPAEACRSDCEWRDEFPLHPQCPERSRPAQCRAPAWTLQTTKFPKYFTPSESIGYTTPATCRIHVSIAYVLPERGPSLLVCRILELRPELKV